MLLVMLAEDIRQAIAINVHRPFDPCHYLLALRNRSVSSSDLLLF